MSLVSGPPLHHNLCILILECPSNRGHAVTDMLRCSLWPDSSCLEAGARYVVPQAPTANVRMNV